MREHSYTTIVFADKKRTGLSFAQYAFCDAVYHLSNNEVGWCYARRNELAEMFDVRPRSIYGWIKDLTEHGFIEKHRETGYIKTTKKWHEMAICKGTNKGKKEGKYSLDDECEKISGDVQNMHQSARSNTQKIHTKGEKISCSLYKDDTKSDNLKNNKNIFTKDVNIAKDANSDTPLIKPLAEKPKQKKRWDSGAWYVNEFCPLYQSKTKQQPLKRDKEFGQAKQFFHSLSSLNPNAPPDEIHNIATQGARIVIDTQAQGGLFGWLDMTPPIGWFSSNADRVDLAFKQLRRITEEELNEQEEAANAIAELNAISEKINASNEENQVTGAPRNALGQGNKLLGRNSGH